MVGRDGGNTLMYVGLQVEDLLYLFFEMPFGTSRRTTVGKVVAGWVGSEVADKLSLCTPCFTELGENLRRKIIIAL